MVPVNALEENRDQGVRFLFIVLQNGADVIRHVDLSQIAMHPEYKPFSLLIVSEPLREFEIIQS